MYLVINHVHMCPKSVSKASCGKHSLLFCLNPHQLKHNNHGVMEAFEAFENFVYTVCITYIL